MNSELRHSTGLLAVHVYVERLPLIKPEAIWVVGTGEPVSRQLKLHTKSTLHNAECTMR